MAAESDEDVDPHLLSQARRKLERAEAQARLSERDRVAAARKGTACDFYFMRTKSFLDRDDERLPRYQDVISDPDAVVTLYLTSAECCQHKFRDKVLVVSHRWDSKEQPDPSGKQVQALKRHVRANPQYEYVWVGAQLT